MSGGPGDGAYHETQVMKTMAVHRGVPAARIDVDRGGWSTRLTVANTVPMLERMGARRVLAVSHWFHLPRIKMEYERSGLSVYTVPARETRTLAAMPWYVMRESAVFWVYWSRPLVARPG